jgi:dihydropteroate synthase
MDLPILMGTSRKAFIRRLVGSSLRLVEPTTTDIDPLHPLVETGTQASVAASVLNGAHLVRVHHIANTLATIRIIDEIL